MSRKSGRINTARQVCHTVAERAVGRAQGAGLTSLLSLLSTHGSGATRQASRMRSPLMRFPYLCSCLIHRGNKGRTHALSLLSLSLGMVKLDRLVVLSLSLFEKPLSQRASACQ